MADPIFELEPAPPIIEFVANTYPALLHCDPDTPIFDTTLNWLQDYLSLVEWKDRKTNYIDGPVWTRIYLDLDPPFPTR